MQRLHFDIDPKVSEGAAGSLYNVDHLQKVVLQNQLSRQNAVSQAGAIIEVQALHYLRQLRVRDAGDMIRSFRQKMEGCRDEELQRSLQELQHHQDPAFAMTELARRLTNKFMHSATTKLRDAAYAERATLINL